MKILMVIAPNKFRDEELFEPKKVFEKNKYKVDITSISKKEAKGMLNGKITPNLLIKDVKVNDYKAVVFVGGSGVEEYKVYENEEFLNLAKKFAEKGKVVAAICYAPRILAKAGLLKGVKCTVFGDHDSIDMLKKEKAKYSGEPIEADNKIVTAEGPQVAEEFAEKILEVIKNVSI